MEVRICRGKLDPEVTESIDEFLQLVGNTNPYHTLAYYHFLHTIPGYTSYYIILYEDFAIQALSLAVRIKADSLAIPILGTRILSMGAPVVHPKQSIVTVLPFITQAYKKLSAGKALFAEIRIIEEMPGDWVPIWKAQGFQGIAWLNSIVNIQHPDFSKQFSDTKQRQLRQAQRKGVHVRPAQDEQEVIRFYHILQGLYQHKVKKPLPPLSFFLKFYSEIQGKQRGVLLLVEWEQTILGGMLAPICAGKGIYEWYIAGLDKDYPGLYPSLMATWGAMEYGHNQGFHFFNFLGLGNPETAYGVRDFKLRFGGKVQHTWRFVHYPHAFNKKIMNSLLFVYKKLKRN